MRFPLTEIVILSVVAILIGYDVIAGKLGQPTESMVLRDWARDYSLLPFVAGFLVGHWFGPRQQVDLSGWMWALPAFGLLFLIDGIWNAKFAQLPIPWWRYSMIYFQLGIPVGMWVWGQPGAWSPLK